MLRNYVGKINIHQKSNPQMLDCDVKINAHVAALHTHTPSLKSLVMNILLYQTTKMLVLNLYNFLQWIGNWNQRAKAWQNCEVLSFAINLSFILWIMLVTYIHSTVTSYKLLLYQPFLKGNCTHIWWIGKLIRVFFSYSTKLMDAWRLHEGCATCCTQKGCQVCW